MPKLNPMKNKKTLEPKKVLGTKKLGTGKRVQKNPKKPDVKKTDVQKQNAATEIKFKPMTVATLKVVRVSDFGAFLCAETGNSDDDILLHKAQQTDEVKIGDVVKVFLYLDPKKRLTASMNLPKMREGQIARLKVINKSSDGIFLDVGAERGIFMPYAEMVGRPQVGDVVWAKLYTDKSGRLATSMKVADEVRRASKPAENIQRGDKIIGAIYNITEAGAFVFSEEKYIVFIPQKEIPRVLKAGEVVEARVTYIREDGRLDASLRDAKENALRDDAEKILKFMQEHGGQMPFNDNTAPEKIYAVFRISKAAFKRAIGHLFSERRIEKISDVWKIRD